MAERGKDEGNIRGEKGKDVGNIRGREREG